MTAITSDGLSGLSVPASPRASRDAVWVGSVCFAVLIFFLLVV